MSQSESLEITELVAFVLFYERHGRWPHNELGSVEWQEARERANAALHLLSRDTRSEEQGQ